MSPTDNVGRISKHAFLVSTSVLLGAVLLSLAVRLYIRLRIQHHFFVDDILIVIGVMFLTAAVGMLYYFIDEMYLAEALLLQSTAVELSFDAIQQSIQFGTWSVVSLLLLWAAITTVKLSFLALFRKLIDRMGPMVRYWWCVFAFVVIVALFGISAYIAPCPVFWDLRALSCSQGPRVRLTFRYAISQMILDIIGDILILVIPIRIIWKIRIKWTQKIALAFSLCLTVIIIAVTVARASGILNDSKIDATWEVYWQYVSAEVGLLMSSATAFRTLFVSRGARPQRREVRTEWYTTLIKPFKWIATAVDSLSSGRRKPIASDGTSKPTEGFQTLPHIPSATMTGIRTFVGRIGKLTQSPSQVMISLDERGSAHSQGSTSRIIDYDAEERWPLPAAPQSSYVERRSKVADWP